VAGLNSLANVTLREIPCNLSFHASPPEVLSQVLVHLCDSSTTCKLGTLFVSVKYVLVSVKLVCVYVKLLKT
jgi:hypothetical protein